MPSTSGGGTTRTPRTGRRPGANDTRGAILDAARERFAAEGYERATLRGIAAVAGVDPALVVHYFKNKAGLFVAAVEWPFRPAEEVQRVARRGRQHVGEELARLFVRTWDDRRERDVILTILRSATADAAAAGLLREFLRDELFTPMMATIGGDHPQLRADLVASQLLGLALARYVLALEPLASADPELVVAAVGPTLQRYFTDELPVGPPAA
jgi:AcrR family transcriptional regulator